MKTVHQVVNCSDSPLYHIWQRTIFLRYLAGAVRTVLPFPLNQHCHLANFREKTLVLHADSAIWATKIRYMGADMMALIKQHAILGKLPIEKVEVRVRPFMQSDSSVPPTLLLSADASTHLKQAAAALSYSPLRITLLRLADEAKPYQVADKRGK